MEQTNVKLFPHLTNEIVADITGFKLDAYLILLEWLRRGLKQKRYKDATELYNIYRTNSNTHRKFFSLITNTTFHYFFRTIGINVANKTVRIFQYNEITKDSLSRNGT